MNENFLPTHLFSTYTINNFQKKFPPTRLFGLHVYSVPWSMYYFSVLRIYFHNSHPFQEIEPTPCPLGCGLEFKNPTSLDVHLKNIHSVTRGQIKQAQKIPMNSNDFLLVLARDNVMCFTSGGCNTKLSCLSSARRHYKQRHGAFQGKDNYTPRINAHLKQTNFLPKNWKCNFCHNFSSFF